jgi:hypothetical protein
MLVIDTKKDASTLREFSSRVARRPKSISAADLIMYGNRINTMLQESFTYEPGRPPSFLDPSKAEFVPIDTVQAVVTALICSPSGVVPDVALPYYIQQKEV